MSPQANKALIQEATIEKARDAKSAGDQHEESSALIKKCKASRESTDSACNRNGYRTTPGTYNNPKQTIQQNLKTMIGYGGNSFPGGAIDGFETDSMSLTANHDQDIPTDEHFNANYYEPYDDGCAVSPIMQGGIELKNSEPAQAVTDNYHNSKFSDVVAKTLEDYDYQLAQSGAHDNQPDELTRTVQEVLASHDNLDTIPTSGKLHSTGTGYNRGYNVGQGMPTSRYSMPEGSIGDNRTVLDVASHHLRSERAYPQGQGDYNQVFQQYPAYLNAQFDHAAGTYNDASYDPFQNQGQNFQNSQKGQLHSNGHGSYTTGFHAQSAQQFGQGGYAGRVPHTSYDRNAMQPLPTMEPNVNNIQDAYGHYHGRSSHVEASPTTYSSVPVQPNMMVPSQGFYPPYGLNYGGVQPNGPSSGRSNGSNSGASGRVGGLDSSRPDTNATPASALRFQSISDWESHRVSDSKNMADVLNVPDETVPNTPREERAYAELMRRSFMDCGRAEDNDTLIRQWKSTCQKDLIGIEDTIWHILKRLKVYHNQASFLNPPHKYSASVKKIQNFRVHVDMLCNAFLTNKTICRHMLSASYTDTAIDDPHGAVTRVENNRKVNREKKEKNLIAKTAAEKLSPEELSEIKKRALENKPNLSTTTRRKRLTRDSEDSVEEDNAEIAVPTRKRTRRRVRADSSGSPYVHGQSGRA